MTWTTCPRCQGESGDFCGGNCHEGGLYICEHCGNDEVENWEECPCCGKVDEDMRLARLNIEAEDGNVESAAELYALESAEHDKVALRAAFLAGVRWVGDPTVNTDLLEALEWIARQYDDSKPIIQCASDAYAMAAWARATIAKAKGGAA